jgi:maltose alpha-D-glucosyltransferase/alpha-amylase
MLRSLHYAAYEALFTQEGQGLIRTGDIAARVSWLRFWYVWVSAAFVQGYQGTVNQSPLLQQTREEFQTLLDTYLLERTFHELSHELHYRRDWVKIPLRGILQLLETGPTH